MRSLPVPRTLRARIVVSGAGSLLVAVALFALATISLVDSSLRGSLDTALRERAQEVALLAVSAPAVLTAPGALESPGSGRELSVEVLDAQGRILARSLSLGSRLLPQDELARSARISGRTGFEPLRLAGREFRMFAAPIARAGGPAAGGSVLVAAETADIGQTTRHLVFVLAVTGAVIALLAALAAATLTRRAMRPLSAVISAAADIERTGDPGRCLPDPTPVRARLPTEIADLTGVLNRMLGSLQRSRDGERRFLADASHELRTPVTTLLGNVHYAARHGAEPEGLADLQRDAEALARLVDDLLTLEREGADQQVRVPLALESLAREVVDSLGSRSGRMKLIVTEVVPVLGDELSLRRAIRNLVENALVHGPPEGVVQISVRRRVQQAELTVSDQGPGPDPVERERLFERFWRGSAATGRPGSGLGLSIVLTIVRRHGGSVQVDGATFTIRLPIA